MGHPLCVLDEVPGTRANCPRPGLQTIPNAEGQWVGSCLEVYRKVFPDWR